MSSRPKAKAKEDGSKPPCDIAIPLFGYQNHIAIDRGFGFIRKWSATDAAAYEGARLRDGLLDKTNAASSVWADTAYRSAANEAFMEKNGFVSRVHRKKPKGKPMPDAGKHPAWAAGDDLALRQTRGRDFKSLWISMSSTRVSMPKSVNARTPSSPTP